MFEIINNTDNDIENIDVIDKYVEFLVQKRELENAVFNIIFVTTEEIHMINKEYRNVDRVTDVISFAFLDNDDFHIKGVPILLGDIYICDEVAIRQANEYNHSLRRELAFLFTHGLLHLFGYDHVNSEEEEKIMFTLQDEILNEVEIKRGDLNEK